MGYSFRHIGDAVNNEHGNFKNTPGRGRKKKLSTSDEKYLKVTSLRN